MPIDLLKKVRGALQPEPPAVGGTTPRAGVPRHSNGLKEFTAGWEEENTCLRILDLGATSSANIGLITALGHSVFNEDLLRPIPMQVLQAPGPEDPEAINAEEYFAANLQQPSGFCDGVLLWDLPDYLPEVLVRPLVSRLEQILKPGGKLLTYLHTREAGAQTPFYRYHIRDRETLELRPGPELPLRRIYNNRNVENLFTNFHSIKFFLARDNLREVVVVR